MRRAAVSVPSNIAGGKGRYSHKDFVHFLYQACRSLFELETQLSMARELESVDQPLFESLESETEGLGRILNGLINRFSSLNSQRLDLVFPKTRHLRPDSCFYQRFEDF
jgi:four helix bundle protein